MTRPASLDFASRTPAITRWFLILLSVALLLGGASPVAAQDPVPSPEEHEANSTAAIRSRKVFIPAIMSRTGTAPSQSTSGSILLGMYPETYWTPMPKDTVAKFFRPVESWSGKRISVAGIFHHLQDNNLSSTVGMLMGDLWAEGYTPLVNMYSSKSAYAIAKGEIDANIRAWAKAYRDYTQNGARMAYLAPLQEMNGYWVPYGNDPENFKIAFKRIQDIFAAEGVERGSVRWVFAPNGYSDPKHASFESYYPGSDRVDAIGFSAYNFGYHPENSYPDWETPQEVFGPYLDRIRAMDGSKPIFIAQAGTTAYAQGGRNSGAKNTWLQDAFNYLAGQANVRGVIYYNADIDYDWSFYISGKTEYTGYRDGVSHPTYGYSTPADLKSAGR